MSLKKNGNGVIRLGDTTDHGGEVVSARKPTNMGRQIACVDDMVRCPKCDGVYPIIEPGLLIEQDEEDTVLSAEQYHSMSLLLISALISNHSPFS